jgi:nitroreductase
VVASVIETGDPVQDEEDLCAAAVASYIVLLGAHGRGLAGYWRTPEVLRRAEGRAAVGVGENERILGLLHLGPPRQERDAPGRLPPRDFVTYLP